MEREPWAVRLVGQGALYDFEGRVVHAREQAWILDIGILVYGNWEDLPVGVVVGDMVSGRAHLEIFGPGVYPESFRVPEEAIYRWHIEAIERETTPWLEPTPERRSRGGSRWALAPSLA